MRANMPGNKSIQWSQRQEGTDCRTRFRLATDAFSVWAYLSDSWICLSRVDWEGKSHGAINGGITANHVKHC